MHSAANGIDPFRIASVGGYHNAVPDRIERTDIASDDPVSNTDPIPELHAAERSFEQRRVGAN